jgi:subtilisin family serine protease
VRSGIEGNNEDSGRQMGNRLSRVAGALLSSVVVAIACGFVTASAQELAYRKEYHSPRLEGSLARLHRNWATGRTALAKRAAAVSGMPIDTNGRIEVVLVPELGMLSESIDLGRLMALGGEVLTQSRHLVEVLVPLDRLAQLTEVPGVTFVRRPFRPQVDSSTSEGSAKVGATTIHTRGHWGRGTKVAVIDAGFDKAMDARANGDLPTTWFARDFTGAGLYTESHHGTACAEIVHDIAPEAELYLIKVASISDLEAATDLVIQDGIDVVTMSLSWYGYGYGDGKGLTCELVDEASQNGILWVNSAGNYATQVYSHMSNDTDGDGLHEFTGNLELLELENVSAGSRVNIWLTWYDWPLTGVDCDLLLYRLSPDGAADLVDYSDTNLRYDAAQEHVYYETPAAGRYAVAVWKEPTHRDVRLKIVSVHHDLKEQHDEFGSISIPADARGALAVGAVYQRFWDTGPVESFSSRGPTFDGRIKPDIVGPDGVLTYSYGSQGYFGTSAATPHIAGAAALLKSTNPRHYTAERLRAALVGGTVDMGAPGKDNTYGWGRLDLSMIPIGEPEMQLSVLALGFGEVVIGQSHTLTLSILNTGTASLVLGNVDLTGSGDFSASSRALVVPPDRSQGVLLSFTPTSIGGKAGTLTLETNLSTSRTRALSLSGTGVRVPPPLAPRLALGLAQVSLGTTEVGRATTQTLSIANTGSATLTVTGISSADPAITVSPTALAIPSGEARAVYVTFLPRSSGVFRTDLTISSDDPDQSTYQVAVLGSVEAVDEVFSLELRPGMAASQGSYLVKADESITVSISGLSLAGAVGFAGVLEYDPDQVTFEGYETGSGIPEVHSPGPKPLARSRVEIAAASFGGVISGDEPDLGILSLRTASRFTETAVRFLEGKIRRNGRFEFLPAPIVLQFATQISGPGDFDGDGRVQFSDFILFAGRYGMSRDDAGFEAKFDMDGSGRIGFEDFILFAGAYGS